MLALVNCNLKLLGLKRAVRSWLCVRGLQKHLMLVVCMVRLFRLSVITWWSGILVKISESII
jgi:hypothetical protein